MSFSLYKDQIVNGSINIDMQDRGYTFGDGVYEVVKVYNGQFFTVVEHVDRFYRSAEKIKLVIPYTKDELHALLQKLVNANNLKTGHVYFQITRGVAPRNHVFPDPAKVEAVLTGFTKEMPRPVDNLEKGVKATLVEDKRWLMCDIKSLNLLGAVLAKQEAAEKGCYEAILYRHNGDNKTVTECSSSNLFGIKDGILYTHEANNLILHGITRAVILECAHDIGMPIKEESFSVEQLLQMDEVIISSTTSEVTPCIEIDGTIFNSGVPGEFTRKLQAQFETKIPSTH